MLKIDTMNNVKNLLSYAMINKIKKCEFIDLSKNLIRYITYISDTHPNHREIYNSIL